MQKGIHFEGGNWIEGFSHTPQCFLQASEFISSENLTSVLYVNCTQVLCSSFLVHNILLWSLFLCCFLLPIKGLKSNLLLQRGLSEQCKGPTVGFVYEHQLYGV